MVLEIDFIPILNSSNLDLIVGQFLIFFLSRSNLRFFNPLTYWKFGDKCIKWNIMTPFCVLYCMAKLTYEFIY